VPSEAGVSKQLVGSSHVSVLTWTYELSSLNEFAVDPL
jgi:hypothetical protein